MAGGGHWSGWDPKEARRQLETIERPEERRKVMSRASDGVTLFTIIEVLTVAVVIAWLLLLEKANPVLRFAGAGVLLYVGLWVEHYVSVNVGAGRVPFGPLPPDRPSDW